MICGSRCFLEDNASPCSGYPPSGTTSAMKLVRLVAKAQMNPVRVDLPGRLFMPAHELEASCRIIELSPDGASLHCEATLDAGAEAVLYVGGFTRFEGVISRSDGDLYHLKFMCSIAKRERISEQIATMLENGFEDRSIVRRHERSGKKGHIQFTRADGQVVSCEVIDISVSGVSVKTNARPLVGEFVLIANIAGRVSRYHEDGIGIEFLGKEL